MEPSGDMAGRQVRKGGGLCRANALVSLCAVAFAAFVTALGIVAAISTSALACDVFEHTYFLPDRPLVNLLAAACVTAGVIYLANNGRFQRLLAWLRSSPKAYGLAKGVLIAAASGIAIAWVLYVDAPPRADQYAVQEAAARFMAGDYADFVPGGYLERYPQQIGLFWVSCLLACVFGPRPYLVLQLINVVGYAIALDRISAVARDFGLGRPGQLASIALGVVFVPFMQYCAFVYGTIWGLALSLAAICRANAFRRKMRMTDAVVCAVYACFAVVLKGNYAIFVIALFLSSLVWLMESRSMRGAILPALLVAGYLLQANVPTACARLATGHALDQGLSAWSWIEMGQQEACMGPAHYDMAPGWFNEYNAHTYDEAGFKTEVQAERAKADLRATLTTFLEQPRYMARFHLMKFASQWTNPTFQGFWNAHLMRVDSLWDTQIPALLTPTSIDRAMRPLDILQFVILAGVLWWCLFSRLRGSDALAFLPVLLAFGGGVLCHVLWEAKCQYTLPYFVLLLPVSVSGYRLAAAALGDAVAERPAGVARALAPRVNRLLLAVVVFVAVAFLVAGIMGLLDPLMADELAYREYLASTIQG